jgi:hypothetical protein
MPSPRFTGILIAFSVLVVACSSTPKPSVAVSSPSIERNVVWQAKSNLKADVYKPGTPGLHPAVLQNSTALPKNFLLEEWWP